jgi:glycosyltransferase involved in cell wall biosynthesis
VKTTKPYDIILAHDSFTQFGGAERVFAAIEELYPTAPIFTLVKSDALSARIGNWNIHPSFLQKVYTVYPKFQHLFPLVPTILSWFRLPPAKVLLSSSSAYLKGLRKPKGSIHINYCHTPTRFLWTDQVVAEKEIWPVLWPLARAYWTYLRHWDKRAASKVDYFIANSKEVQQRIKKYYGRDSQIIYPFVDTTFWHPTSTKQNYFLIGGRLQRAKNLDIVIEVCNKLQVPLHVIGTGRHEQFLKSIAGPTVKFFGAISDEELRDQYSGATAFIYPQIEDFGIMPLEAASCGTPTIAVAKAGSLETVIPGQTGVLMPEFTASTLEAAILAHKPEQYQKAALQAHAETFSKTVFQTRLAEFVKQVTPDT